jgi:hypothetical protein
MNGWEGRSVWLEWEWEENINLSEPSGDLRLRARPLCAPGHTRRRRRPYLQRRTVEHRGHGRKASFRLC